MGVRGLTALIGNNPQLFSDHKLCNCSLVIDGNNLCYQLHRRFRCNIFMGGDYNVFYASCTEFFVTLRRFSIVPYVVFDGAHNLGDAKLKTTMNRAKERLSRAGYMTQGYSVTGGFLPILALIVFEDVLRDLDISTFIHSDYEADQQIVGLANELECPVLSEDSDFFIYDLKGGFVPFCSLNFTVFRNDLNKDKAKEPQYLSVRIYFVAEFIKNFNHLNREMLPLFAVLAVDDYVDDADLSSFYRNVIEVKKHPRTGSGCKLAVRKFEKRMISLLNWLRTKDTVDEALNVVASHLKGRVPKKMILDAVNSYTVKNSSIAKELGIEVKGDEKEEEEEEEAVIVTSSDGSVLPHWFVVGCRRGEFPQFLMNLAVHRRAILSVQLERWDLASSYASSLHLRRVIYGMLFAVRTDGRNDVSISEIGRKRHKVHKTSVLPLCQLPNGVSVPSYEQVRDFDRETRLRFLMDVLDVPNYEVLLELPLDWQLFVCTIIYWVRSAEIKISLPYLSSVILMGIYVNIVSSCSMTKRDNVDVFLSDQDVSGCKARLSEYQSKYLRISKFETPNIGSLHSYGELQTCLLFAECLNCLLDRPLSWLRVASLLNGTFLYNMYEELSKRSNWESFCVQLLGKDTLLYEFFCKVRAVITQRLSMGLTEIVSEPSEQGNVIRKNKRRSNRRR